MLEKAKIVVVETREEIPVMYNPTDLNDNKSLEVNGLGANVQFQRVNLENFTVNLFFDTYEQGTDVRKQTKRLEKLMKPTQGDGTRKEPPVVLFSWNEVWFKGLIVDLRQSFTLFLPSGAPVRARLTVTFKSVLSEEEQLEALGFFNCRKLWPVKPGDRLDLIAKKALGDPAKWRMIATLNKILNPTTFPTSEQTGMVLAIPDIHQGQ